MDTPFLKKQKEIYDLLSMEALGRRIATLRHQSGLTQADVAEVCFVTVQAVSKWERGLSCPDALMMERIADALKIPVHALYCEEPEKESFV